MKFLINLIIVVSWTFSTAFTFKLIYESIVKAITK